MNLLRLLTIRPEIAYIYICSKITLIFHAQYWTGTGAELMNILGYQMARILTLVLKSSFFVTASIFGLCN